MATATSVPISDGSTLEWTPNSGTTHYTRLGDPAGSPDDDTTYVSTSTDSFGDSVDCAPFSLPGTVSIDSVQIIARAKLTAGSGNIRIHGVINGSATFGPAGPQAVTGSYANYTETWTTNPDTGQVWTQADVQGTGPNPLGVRMGFYSHSLSGTMRVTSIYMRVTYTAAGGGGIAARASSLRRRR